jgi:hypothetical protein
MDVLLAWFVAIAAGGVWLKSVWAGLFIGGAVYALMPDARANRR